MLALVALLTGGFLVFSAQSLSVARRLRAFALVRTLGLPRSGIVATVALEGLAIGLIGALLGLLLGYALAWGAVASLGGDLGAGYFSGGNVRLGFSPGGATGFFGLGVLTAVLGSVVPARLAARAAPAVALRNAGDVVDPRAPVNWAILHGETQVGATLHQMVKRADAGCISGRVKRVVCKYSAIFRV
jgi:putative ABC transport system permease protein